MKKIFSAIAVLTAFAMVAVSCSDDDTKDEDIPVTEVKVTPATGSVVAGTTLTLKAEILPENATNKTVEWVSRTPETATVDKSTGVVTGVAEGEAVIMAICGGKTAKRHSPSPQLRSVSRKSNFRRPNWPCSSARPRN